MTWARHDDDFLLTDDESDGRTDDEIDSLFDKSDDDTDDTDDTEILPNKSDGDTDDADDTEILPNKSDGNTDDEGWLSDDGGQRPSEYYLAEGANLNVKRYGSDDTAQRHRSGSTR